MKKLLDVWRDLYTNFELTGSLYQDGRAIRFQYAQGYEGVPISVTLPIQEEPFTPEQTRIFFSALNPEGKTRENLVKIIRMGSDEYEPLLERLGDETIGALTFSSPDSKPGEKAQYVAIGQDLLDSLAVSPTATAVNIMSEARLSLSGAMAKIGLYRNEDDRSWFLPIGSAPSNCIVKAGGDMFAHEVLNEAMCLDIARRCGFPVADAEVIRTTGENTLLAISRFDRPVPDNAHLIDGQPAPIRLHQEDFCQACSLDPMWKYEPAEGNYLRRITTAASRYCANGFGESQLLLEYVLFDYLIGNCDNHLKNYSLLYSNDWLSKEVAPLYDVVCTTIYPNLITEMGVSLSENRSILGLTRDKLEQAISQAGLPTTLGMSAFDGLARELPAAIEESRDSFLAKGFNEARPLADLLMDGVSKRAAFNFTKSNAKTL